MIVGRIRELWRYPVKSMLGERIEAAPLGANGIPGDRAWAVRDEERGGIRGAKKIPALMRLRARYREEPTAERVPAPEIELPGAEPRRDLSKLPPELFQFESPPGTYVDAFPLLELSDATLRRLQRLAPKSRVDVRRFRPNLVVATPDGVEGFAELDWIGKRVRIGQAEISVAMACPRCVMITHAFEDLPQDTGLMRTVVREADQNVGVYARVERAGRVAVGDAVEVLS